ncbi:MAG: protein kinase domain-containing protein [Candidatus Acidiferrales bacterium]
MGLSSGTKLGPYEIVAPLGAGGMGEVYRARDTRLDRTVAIKILASRLADNPEAKQRLDREARAISSLNHPNICTLHDVGHQDGIHFLVMEYLEGETLADRLKKGPLPLEQVLRIGAEIAAGLDKAHRSGVVHRDLKPGNIMLTKTGAKLMDFGLAKGASAAAPALSGLTASIESPAGGHPLTAEGTVVGTFQYMSPEQIEGQDADARSDIFSLGAVLYEMVTGQRAFEGKSQLSVASAILEREPEPISMVKPLTPPVLDRTIRKCLAKQPDQRWQSASDLATELNWMTDGSATAMAVKAVERGRKWGRLGWLVSGALLLLLAGGGSAWITARRSVAPARVMRFTVSLPAGDALGGSWWWYPSVAVSHDGSQIAYVAHRGGQSQIYLRAVGEMNARPVPGTEGADIPFFSPDGKWLGMASSGEIKKVPLAGGPTVTIAKATFYSANWAPDDMIYFDGESGLQKVAAAGGEPQKVTTLDAKSQETEHRFPEVLPGGKALIFTLRDGEQPSFDNANIAALDLATGEKKILVKSGTDAHYVSTGYLVFLRAGMLMAVPFDPARLQVKGAAAPVAEDILENPRIGAGQYAISDDGSLVYIAGGVTYGEHELVFVDKTGATRSLTATKRPYEDFTISPDGKFIATTIEGQVTDTWIHDIARDTETRFTSGVENRDPTWTPDGKRIAYGGFKKGKYGVYWRPLDGSAPEVTLLTSDKPVYAWSWSSDGRVLLYEELSAGINYNLGILPMNDREHPRLLFSPQHNVNSAALSPDGDWIAYDSDESGRPEVYVAPYPRLAPRERISTEGGLRPVWAPDGRELYYRTVASVEELLRRALAQRSRVMAVPIETKPTFKAGTPHMLFEGPFFESGHDFAVTPDGRGFILIRESASQSDPNEIHIVLNWFEELKQRVPSARN